MKIVFHSFSFKRSFEPGKTCPKSVFNGGSKSAVYLTYVLYSNFLCVTDLEFLGVDT